MIQSYVIQEPEDLNEIEDLSNNFYIIITLKDSGWIRYYIRPHYFKGTFFVIDNCNNFINEYSSLVEAVKKCYEQINYELYG